MNGYKSGQSFCLLTTSIIVVIPAFVVGKHPKSGHFAKTQSDILTFVITFKK